MDHEGKWSRDHFKRHASSGVTGRAPMSPLLATDYPGKLQARGF